MARWLVQYAKLLAGSAYSVGSAAIVTGSAIAALTVAWAKIVTPGGGLDSAETVLWWAWHGSPIFASVRSHPVGEG